MQDLHLLLLDLGNDAVLSGVAQDQPLFHCPVQGVMEHHVDASHCAVTQSWLLALLGFTQSAILLEILVEFLYVPAGEFLQLDFSDPGNNV